MPSPSLSPPRHAPPPLPTPPPPLPPPPTLITHHHLLHHHHHHHHPPPPTSEAICRVVQHGTDRQGWKQALSCRSQLPPTTRTGDKCSSFVRNVVWNRLVVVIVTAESSRRRLLHPPVDCGRLWPVWPIVVAASSSWISISLVLYHYTNSRHARSALQPTPAHRTSLGCTNDDRRHSADDWLADLSVRAGGLAR